MKLLRSANRGSSLPAALIIVMVMCVMIAAAFEFTNGIGRHVQGTTAVDTAIGVADGALDYLYAHWRQVARKSANLAPTTSEFTNIPTPTMSYFADVKNCVLKNFSIVAVDPLLQPLATATTTPPTSPWTWPSPTAPT